MTTLCKAGDTGLTSVDRVFGTAFYVKLSPVVGFYGSKRGELTVGNTKNDFFQDLRTFPGVGKANLGVDRIRLTGVGIICADNPAERSVCLKRSVPHEQMKSSKRTVVMVNLSLFLYF
jgi:hypothetical protein